VNLKIENQVTREAVAGIAGGVVGAAFCQPVDVVATRRMLVSGSTAVSQSLRGDLKAIVVEGGVARLYRGLGPQILASVPCAVGMYTAERFFRRRLANPDGTEKVACVWFSGVMSGITETALTCPFEVAKVRLQSKQYIGLYKNTTDVFRKVVSQEGVTRLYSGASPTLMRNCTFNSQFFAGLYLLKHEVMPEAESKAQEFGQNIAAGVIMGIVGTPLKMPFFIVKSRLQEQRLGHAKYTGNVFQIQAQIVREEGFRALWKGNWASSVRQSISGATVLSTFTLVSTLLDPIER